MRVNRIYADYLDVSWLGDRKLIARYSSIAEYDNYEPPSSDTPSPQWEEWGKELAKLNSPKNYQGF